MIARFSDSFHNARPPEYDALIRLLVAFLSDEQYNALLEKQLKPMPRFAERRKLLELGHFSLFDLINLLLATGAENGVNPRTVAELLRRLTEWSLVTDNDMGMDGQTVRYQFNKAAIGLFGTLGLIDNVLLGRAHIVAKYKASIPAIVVEKDGRERIGTGYLVHNHYKGQHFSGQGWIATARHNIDPDAGIKFLRFAETDPVTYHPLRDSWILHKTRDIAAMPVQVMGIATPIYPFGTAAVLSRTISMGYPTISSTDRAYLLAHNGEVNATVTSYMDQQEYLLISNSVAPGNSGGPVLDDAGLLVGMVVQALEGEYEGGISKANAAIPALEIMSFLQEIDPPTVTKNA